MKAWFLTKKSYCIGTCFFNINSHWERITQKFLFEYFFINILAEKTYLFECQYFMNKS